MRKGGSFNPRHIYHGLAQHLQAAANAQHAPAAGGMLADGGIQPLLAQPVQIADRGLAAGQNDPILRR